MDQSMTVIGGADGPTAIFLASKVNLPLIIAAAVVVIGVAVWLIVRASKKKKK